MLNRTVLVGRLTRDPDLRYVGDGKPVVSFTLAVNRTFKNQNGETEADFINCVAWRNAENIAKFLKKGSMAGVDGRLQTRSYDDQSGRRVFVTEVNVESVQFLDPKGGAGRNQSSGQQGNSFPDDPFANDGKPIDISDEDLQF
ncbi:single-stranded DNA-binding protein [Bacillus paralicheniformis]|uniref:single-stranded DNA-binding protein n=1 Tax=Bacillus TaxID=1386 RepID=UPI000952492E|nr:single-stranded DNA-binding protein [Bacillus paralicheniformis]OLQ52638.1 single-stranded DNA-binding protein [Bacillus paralicheniformis]TWM59935.1 Single-stranded DNA-binding protein A [Bacillus paralicheniformis]